MYSSLIPYAAFTQFTPTLPEFYWNVYSSEQRIKHICYELCKLHAYSDYLAEQINLLGEDVEGELKEMQRKIEQEQKSFRDEIMHILADLQIGSLQWDVQHGKYTPTIEAQRDMFNDVTVHSYNNEQLETVFESTNMTVEKLANSGLNVKGYAVMNHALLEPDAITDDLTPDEPRSEGRLTVNDLNKAFLDVNGYVFVN